MGSPVGRLILAAGLCLCCSPALAQYTAGSVTLPDSGVDLPDTITALGMEYGPVVAAALALTLGFLGLRVAFSWLVRLVK